MLKIVIILCLCLSFDLASAQTTPKPKVLLRTIEAATNFPAFNRFIEKQGVPILQQQLNMNIPYIDVKNNDKARYFGIGRVASYNYFYVEAQNSAQRKSLLAKVILTLFIYDIEDQQTVLKRDFVGIKAVPYDESEKTSLVVLKKAFKEAARLASNHLDVPLYGTILAVNSESITVDIGSFHSVSANDKLDVIDPTGKSLGFAEVLSSALKREQCKAYFSSNNATVSPGNKVRLVTDSPEELKGDKELEQEVIGESMQMRNVIFTKQAISPNPPLKLEVDISHRDHIVYIGEKMRSIALYVYGFDAWEDEITVKDNITWKPDNWDISSSVKGDFLLAANKFGRLDLIACYTTSVTQKRVKSTAIPLEIRQLKRLVFTSPYIVVSPGKEQKLNLQTIYNEQKVLSIDTLQSELVWEYDANIVEIRNGHVIAKTPCNTLIKVFSKSVPQTMTHLNIICFASAQVQIFEWPERLLNNNETLILDHKQKVRLTWKIKGLEKEIHRPLEIEWQIDQPQWGEINNDGNNLFFIAGLKKTTTPIKVTARIKHVGHNSLRKDTTATMWIEIRPPFLSTKFAIIGVISFLCVLIVFTLARKFIKARKPFPIPRKFNICYLQVDNTKNKRYIYFVHKKSAIIGRSSSCDIQIYHTNAHGNPNKEMTNFISRKHCQLSLVNNKIWLEKLAQTEKHNITVVNEDQKIADGIKHCINNDDIIKIGRLQLKVNLWHNKNKQVECLRLQYVNNPHNHEEFVIIFTKATFGSGINVPVRIRENIPEVTGEFTAQQNHIFMQFYTKKIFIKSLFINKQPRPLIAGEIMNIGKQKISVCLEDD
ncbi:FHA domain-containing protein [Candidatus Uabimicrobium sp. HlEnr_7]|uniref:FHA domain-containing protein n=1 Tax=Candidatus Uabimicrobium helgolandensis TaxID=3095367 RepID=UPI00355935B9